MIPLLLMIALLSAGPTDATKAFNFRLTPFGCFAFLNDEIL